MALSNNYIERIRLLVGDIDEDYEYFPDSTYEFIYLDNGQNELVAAIVAMENLINYIALNPESERLGQVQGSRMSVEALTLRLESLKQRLYNGGDSYNKRLPMIVKSDRSSWSDFDSLFKY